MDNEAIKRLLESVAAGERSVDEAATRLSDGVFAGGGGYADLGFAKVDTHRPLRTGEPEVVYGAGKTVEQVVAITARLRAAHPEHPVLVTRADDATRAALRSRFPDFTEDPVAAIGAVGASPSPERGTVAVLCAGTSDLPVAAEAAFTARAFGLGVTTVSDVGVAGLHRLLAARDVVRAADCVIVVAGMDGALPSAVGGLVSVPLIAVPTSVGYGAAFGGLAPLLTMLNSCAPGISVVNIDNGFGAAVCASRIVRTVRLKPLRRRKQSGAAVRAVRRGARVSAPVCAARIVRSAGCARGIVSGRPRRPGHPGGDRTGVGVWHSRAGSSRWCGRRRISCMVRMSAPGSSRWCGRWAAGPGGRRSWAPDRRGRCGAAAASRPGPTGVALIRWGGALHPAVWVRRRG